MPTVKIGDRIKFRATTRWNCGTVWRIVKEIYPKGGVAVRYGGWPQFYVRPHEIIQIRPKKES